MLRRRLLGTMSVFRLDRTDIKTTDPNNPLALLNLGEQRTDGAEVNLQGSLARGWQVFGGYAWLDGRRVSSTTLSNGVSLQGRRSAMSALHGGSLWTTCSFGNGLGFGAGMVTRARQFAATDNLAALPAYARVDSSVFYRKARYEVQANVQNVGNIRYYDAAQSEYQIYPAAPISGAVAVLGSGAPHVLLVHGERRLTGSVFIGIELVCPSHSYTEGSQCMQDADG